MTQASSLDTPLRNASGRRRRRASRPLGLSAALPALAVAMMLRPAPLAAQQADENGAEERSLDISAGPIQGSTRTIGLAGASVAIAVGVDGLPSNPAAVAVRRDYSWTEWDTGFGVDVGIGAWLPQTRLINTSGQTQSAEDARQRSLLFGRLSFSVQYRKLGLGLSADGRRQALRGAPGAGAGLSPTDLRANFGVIHGALGYALLSRDLVVGLGPRVTGFSFDGLSNALDSGALRVAGIGYHLGAIYKPLELPLRVGAAYTSPISPSVDASDEGSLWVPEAVALPWELAVGAAYQFGPRPLNQPFVSLEQRARRARLAAEHIEGGEGPSQASLEARERAARRTARARYASLPRRYLLVSAELRAVGRVSDGVGLTGLLGGGRLGTTSGTSLSPRVGAETEALPDWLKLRAGSYWEPARVAGASPRLHGTFGFDVKLFQWDVFGLVTDFDHWQLSAALDAADNYLNTTFSVGFWH